MILSFGWTTPALLAGVKTVTRREWTPKHAAHFYPGKIVDAWNATPRVVSKTPHKVAELEILSCVLEPTANAPIEDFEREGFGYLQAAGIKLDGMTPVTLWRLWHRDRQRLMYTVRFRVLRYLEGPVAK